MKPRPAPQPLLGDLGVPWRPFLNLVQQGPIPGQSLALVLPLPFQLASTSPAGTQGPEVQLCPSPASAWAHSPTGPPALLCRTRAWLGLRPTTKEVSDLAGRRAGYKRGRQRLVEEEGSLGAPTPGLLLIRKMGLNQALKQESRPAGRSACSGPPRLDPLGQMEAPHPSTVHATKD